MDKYTALEAMLSLFIVEVGTHTTFDVPYLLQCMERELKYRRTTDANPAWMEEFVGNYRLAKAIHKAYPGLTAMHPGPVNICYWKR
jgi:hypothetical protein